MMMKKMNWIQVFLCAATVSSISNSIHIPGERFRWEFSAMVQLSVAVSGYSWTDLKRLLDGRDTPHEADDSTEAKS